MSVGDIWRRGK